jgi:hypothetical protein
MELEALLPRLQNPATGLYYYELIQFRPHLTSCLLNIRLINIIYIYV